MEPEKAGTLKAVTVVLSVRKMEPDDLALVRLLGRLNAQDV